MTPRPGFPPGLTLKHLAAQGLMIFLKDVLYTDTYLIKGHVKTGERRLSSYLNNTRKHFVEIEEATLLKHDGGERIPASRMQVNVRNILFAHESEDTGDEALRNLAKQQRDEIRVTTYFSSTPPLQLSGSIDKRLVDSNTNRLHDFIVVVRPEFRGLPDNVAPEYDLFRDLEYVIVNRDRLTFFFQ